MAGYTSPTGGSLYVERGTVVCVYPREYAVDVMTEASRPAQRLQVMHPAGHADHGGGSHSMPEKGAECLVAIGPDGVPFILGFINKSYVNNSGGDGELDYSYAKPPMDPGDVRHATADGNQITLRRGGIVEVESTAACKTLYIPVYNLIRHYFFRLEGVSPLGDFEWGHALLDSSGSLDTTAETPVLIKYNIREKAQDENYLVELRVGKLDNAMLDPSSGQLHLFRPSSLSSEAGTLPTAMPQDGGALSLLVRKSGSADPGVLLQINNAGHAFLYTAGNLHIKTLGGVLIEADDGVHIKANNASLKLTDSAELLASLLSLLNVDADSITLSAKKSLTVQVGAVSIALTPFGVVISAPSVALGGSGSMRGVIAGADLLTWLTTHTHVVPTIGTPTAPPTIPPPTTAVSAKVRV